MKTTRMHVLFTAFCTSALALPLGGCEQQGGAPGANAPATKAPATNAPAGDTAHAAGGHAHSAGDGHDHDHHDGDGHDHDHDHSAGGAHDDHDGHDHADGGGHDHDHGPKSDLGVQTSGAFTVKATQAGDVKAGADASFDVVITSAAKPAAVRFWVGSQDGRGSVKAKGEADQAGWHAHVEVPSPLPAGSRLWVEVQPENGEKVVVGFDLKG